MLDFICVGGDGRRPQGALEFKLLFCHYCCLSKFTLPLAVPLQLGAVAWHGVVCVCASPWLQRAPRSGCCLLCTLSMEKYFGLYECTCTREGLCCTKSDLSLLFIYFFYFKRKHLQIVLPWSEMYLMPKALFFCTLIVHLTDKVGKRGKTSYTQRMLLLLPTLEAFLTAAWAAAFPKGVQVWIPTALNLKELLPFLPLAAD